MIDLKASMKKMSYIVILLFSALIFCGNIWVWTDENGVRHFSNVAPPEGMDVRETEETNRVTKTLQSADENGYRFKVLKVYDGDTLQVGGLDLVFKVRLVGIDSPEIGYNGRKSQPYSRKAKQFLTDLIAQKRVLLKSYGIGGFNRQLCEVFVDGTNVNLEMVRQGLAEVYQGRRPKTLDSNAYFDAESLARKAVIGIWRQNGAYESPKQWRKENPRK